MSDNPLKAAGAALFRWYLSRFSPARRQGFFCMSISIRPAAGERLLTVTLDKGFRMRLDMEDAEQRKSTSSVITTNATKRPLVAKVLDPGEVFWDVGANVGYFSLVAAAAVGQAGQVLAFEPGPRPWPG